MGSDRPPPTMEQIDGWYRGSRPDPSDSPWGRFVYRSQRRTWLSLKVFIALWYAVITLITTSAAIDVFGHMGWGYHLNDVWDGLLMMVLGVLVFAFLTLVQRVVSGAAGRIYGPDQSEKHGKSKVS